MTERTAEPESERIGWGALRRRYFGPLVLAVLVLRFLAHNLSLALLVPVHTDITFPEGALVAAALDVAHGESPYHDWRQWPHRFSPYPPLTYYPVGWAARCLAARPTPHVVYVLGRLLSCACLVGIYVLVYLLARRLALSRAWSVAAVALLSAFRLVLDYGASYRPDAPKAFFALLAVWIVTRRGRSATWRTALAALACLYVSFWFKPAAWWAPVVVFLWMARGWGARRTAAWGAAFVAAGLAGVFALDRYWNGLLLPNLIDSVANGITWGNFAGRLGWGFVLPGAILLVGASAFAFTGSRSSDVGEARLALQAAPVALIVALAQFFKAGADVNYFLDAFALACVGFCALAARLWNDGAPLPMPLREALLGIGLAALLFVAGSDLAVVRDDLAPTRHPWSETAIESEARRAGGPVLTPHPYIALANGQPTVLDHFPYAILCRRGRIDPEPLLERLRTRAFAEVIIENSLLRQSSAGVLLYHPQFQPLLRSNYRLLKMTGPFCVFVPAGPSPDVLGGK